MYRGKVLVVDDDGAVNAMLSDVLSRHGYHTDTADAGEHALAKYRRDAYDVVVSDVEMPALDGLSLTTRIRSTERFMDLPVILVSSHKTPDDIRAGVDAGADEYLVKGEFEQDTLLEVISRYI